MMPLPDGFEALRQAAWALYDSFDQETWWAELLEDCTVDAGVACAIANGVAGDLFGSPRPPEFWAVWDFHFKFASPLLEAAGAGGCAPEALRLTERIMNVSRALARALNDGDLKKRRGHMWSGKRELHTALNELAIYSDHLANAKSPRELPAAALPVGSTPGNDARDRFMNELAESLTPWQAILQKMNNVADQHGWEKLENLNSVRAAVIRYRNRHHLPPLPKRRQPTIR